ncbi:MAG: GIY-YIG nuclease family protein [Gammaproteobacteria bacterium]|nr:GIY-YIG nuclease family protein [Gammaproteobacteria bacterium]
MNNPLPIIITIHAVEGRLDGLRLVDKSGWDGRTIVCPRVRYPHVKKNREFSESGAYILFGRGTTPTIYIGESDNVGARLGEHHNEDFWQQAVIFIRKGNTLNKAEIKYLEARLVELAKEAEKNLRCELRNRTKPQRPSLSDADEASIAVYFEQLLLLLPVLGIDVFAHVEKTPGDREYYCKSADKNLKGKDTWNATGYVTSNGFMVRAGSTARKGTAPSMTTHHPSNAYLHKREDLKSSRILVEKDGCFRFEVDHEFNSPTEAASVCTGRTANGPAVWKDEKGTTLKEHRAREEA